MPQRFTATENAFEKGIENTSPKAGAKLAGDWVEALQKADFPGAKGLAGNLEKLQKELSGDEPDGAKIKTLMEQIGEATAKSAERAEEEKVAAKVRELADAMGAKTKAKA